MTKKKAKKKSRNDAGMRHRGVGKNWIGYTGNKSSIINMILDLLPKGTNTFVDLFGGSGYVGVSVLKDHRAKRVVYNEFEYDFARTLAFMAENSPDDIIEYYTKLQHYYFGDIERLTAKSKPIWLKMRDDYNKLNIRFDSTAEQKRAKEKWIRDLEKKVSQGKMTQEEATELRRILKPELMLMFLSKTSYRATPRFADSGRRYSATPNTAGDGHKFQDPERMREFLTVLHEMWEKEQIDIYSHNFLDLHLRNRIATRQRPDTPRINDYIGGRPQDAWAAQGDFMELLADLKDGDVVFADPPYAASGSLYGKSWPASSEVALLALLDAVNANGAQYMLTNNLQYDNPILSAWIDARSGSDRKHVWLLPKEYIDNNQKPKGDKAQKRPGIEVFVTNYPRSASRVKYSNQLVEVPQGRKPFEFGCELLGIDPAQYQQ